MAITLMFPSNGKAQTVHTVGGPGSDYTTLKQAFDAINSGQLTGGIVLQITGNTTETVTAALNRSGTGAASYTSVLVYPVLADLSISGNINGALISLNGASNVVIDGRVDTTGTTASLSISNSSTGTGSTNSAIQLLNSATGNHVLYCNLLASGTATAASVILYSSSTTGNGNNNNLIEWCMLSGTNDNAPTNIIYSSGTAGRENRFNIIKNNHFKDYFRTNASCFGINIAAHSYGWEILDNHFYYTVPFTPTGSNRVYYSIRIAYANINNHFMVGGNWIGGSAPFCGGAPMEMSSGANFRYYAVHAALGVNATNTIRENTIRNISIQSTHANHFYGITVSSGNVVLENNMVGSPTGNDHITLMNSTASSTSYGFHLTTAGEILMQGNTVGGISAYGSNTLSHSFIGVLGTVSGRLEFEQNLIGSLTTPNSIQSGSSSTSSTAQNTIGIQAGVTGSILIKANTIANLHNAYARSTTTSGQVAGIIVTGAGASAIAGNIVRDLSTTSASSGATNAASVIGIAARSTGADEEVSDNTISHLRNIHPTAAVQVIGIFYEGSLAGFNRVDRNYIHSLGLSSSSASAAINGIRALAGNTHYLNNIITLGDGENQGCLIYGIYETGAASHHSYIFHNTIQISGNPTGNAHSYALFSNATTNIRDIRNNVLVNERSTQSGSGRNYAVRIGGTTNLTINRNNYYHSGNNGSVGMNNTTTINTLSAWQAAITQDIGSISLDPVWAGTGSVISEHYTPTIDLQGEYLSSVAEDYDNTLRPDPPTMGAVEYLQAWTGAANNEWGQASNWTGNLVPVQGKSILIPEGCYFYPILTQFIEVGKLNIRPNASLTIGSQGSLTVTGKLTNGAGHQGLVIQSDVLSSGSLIHSTPGIEGTMFCTMPGDTLAWHMITSPVSDQTITGSDFEPGNSDEFYLWHEPSPGTWVNYKNQDGSGGYPSFPFANHGGNLFVTGKGYIAAYQAENPAKTFQGTFHAGEITLPLQSSGAKTWNWEAGWNLIGNPYPSSLDWNLVDKHHLAEIHAQVYDPAFGTGGGYRTVTTIAPNQGFFVKAVSSGGSIIPTDPVIALNSSMQTHGGSFLKVNQQLFANKLSIRILQQAFYDEAQILIADGASLSYDFLDATKLFSYHPEVPQIFSRSKDDRWLSVNTLPEIPLQTVIPLSYTAAVQGAATIAIHEITGKLATAQIYLHDHLLDSLVNLSQTLFYGFMASPGEHHDRFSLRFGTLQIPGKALLDAYSFNNNLVIQTTLPKTTLRVYAPEGKQVFQITLGPGIHTIPTTFTQGVYIVLLNAPEETLSKKLFFSGH